VIAPIAGIANGTSGKRDDGIVVNEYLEASRAGIYAAGDVANYPDTIFGKRRRVEHWDNAVSQGQHWARVVLGERQPFVHVPYFFSDVFDLSYELWGDTAGTSKIVVRGDANSSSFSVWWLTDNQVMAAFVMNRPDEEREVVPEWIKSSQTVSPERLSDKNRSWKLYRLKGVTDPPNGQGVESSAEILAVRRSISAETAALPNVCPALATFKLAGPLLEGAGLAGLVHLGRMGLAQNVAQLDNVLLRRGSFRQRRFFPDCDALGQRQWHHPIPSGKPMLGVVFALSKLSAGVAKAGFGEVIAIAPG
jgi:hypothetical protein